MNEKKVLLKKINKILINQFGIPKRQNPLPKPLDTLIATILSQNTNDNNSYKAYKNLKNSVKSWEELKNVKKAAIERLIRIGGLAKQKSSAIKNLITELSKNGDFNLDYIKNIDNNLAIKQLISFKGVGVKTASCVLLFSLDRNICPVDTHVHRILNRIGIVKEKTPDKTFYAINENLPQGIAHSLHTNLILLGREICKPFKPNCSACPLIKICDYPTKNLTIINPKKRNTFLLLDNV